MKSDKLYNKSPTIGKDERGQAALHRGAPMNRADGVDAGIMSSAPVPGGGGGDMQMHLHGHERREMHQRHVKEHMDMHHRHEMEHAMGGHTDPAMLMKHEDEHASMHDRHLQERKEMHQRHLGMPMGGEREEAGKKE